jgi:hypothetical protein
VPRSLEDPAIAWSLREVLLVIVDFADPPDAAIARIGDGKISVPEDRAQDLDHFLKVALSRAPKLATVPLLRLAREIDRTLDRKSRGGPAFELGFWSNRGFRRHSEWKRIRRRCRKFLYG